MTARETPVVREYAGWAAFLAEARGAPWSPGVARDWFGGVTRDEALKLAERGWPQGMRYIRDVALPVVQTHASRLVAGSGWTWDVTGAAYDVGALLSGVPEHWLTPVAVEQRPVVTVAVNVATSGGIPAKVITLRGAGVVALTLALENAGYAVDVVMICGSRPDDKRDTWIRVSLTDAAGGPLDTDRLMYALAHPSATRGFVYALEQALVGVSADSDIKWPVSPCPWTADVFLAPAHLGDVTNWQNRAAVERWVERTFRKIAEGGKP